MLCTFSAQQSGVYADRLTRKCSGKFHSVPMKKLVLEIWTFGSGSAKAPSCIAHFSMATLVFGSIRQAAKIVVIL
jgi:hypothetical protein